MSDELHKYMINGVYHYSEADVDAELAALRSACEAALVYLDSVDRGTTHYEGCEKDHPRCALAKQLRAALKEA